MYGILTREIGFKFCNFCWDKIKRMSQNKVKMRIHETHWDKLAVSETLALCSLFGLIPLSVVVPEVSKCLEQHVIRPKAENSPTSFLHICPRPSAYGDEIKKKYISCFEHNDAVGKLDRKCRSRTKKGIRGKTQEG